MIQYRYFPLVDLVVKIIFRLSRKFKIIPCINIDTIESVKSIEIALKNKKRLFLVSGFDFQDYTLLDKYHEEIISRYRNTKVNKDIVYLDNFKKNGRIIIGVHIRQGDYAHFGGGKYFYSPEEYINILKEFIKDNNIDNPLIAIFSDQHITDTQFYDFADVFISRNTYNIDYTLMGLCTYLIGPPSTFTLWASYTYRVPYYHIYDPLRKNINPTDFTIAYTKK